MFLENTERHTDIGHSSSRFHTGSHTDPLGQRHPESQMERGLRSSEVAHVDWWAPHGPSAAVSAPPDPHFNWFCFQQGKNRHVTQQSEGKEFSPLCKDGIRGQERDALGSCHFEEELGK